MQNDDDKKTSFERWDETKVERNERSFFDWLVGEKEAEESEEKRLRKKLDKELKEAARKRAEQFEEERRIEEQREVAETRKLKKRWRAKLVEKSKTQLEEAEALEDAPTDGYTIAKLMVAERIIKLSDMLENEDLRRSEIKALKIHIDFMGLLSEKLSRPDIEVPPEVEKLYRTIAASVEENAENDPQSESKFSIPRSKTKEAPPESEDEHRYRVFAAGIVAAIRRAVKRVPPAPTLDVAPETDGDGPAVPTERLPYTRTIPEAPERPAETKANRFETSLETIVPLGVLKVIREETQPAEAIREEIKHNHAVRRLAEIVDQAKTITETPSKPEPPMPPAPVLARTRAEAPAAAAASPPEPEFSFGLKPPQPDRTEQAHRPDFPETDFEFWSEADLVRKAWTIHLGDGQYLADAYQKGFLDKQGLIKILKSHKKGRDYITEYSVRRKNLENLAISPETLTPADKAPADKSDTVRLTPVQTKPEAKTPPEPKLGPEPASQAKAAKAAQNLARLFPKGPKKQAGIYLLLASVLTILVLAAIVLKVFNGL